MSKRMNYLEKWLLFYLDGVEGNQLCWRDGENIAEALANIDPVWFSKIRAKMRPRASTSWVFMRRNLKIIMNAIRGYYSGYLGLVLSKEREPVLGLIARVGDQVELEKMMQLVLGCAVTGRERGENINRILSLEKKLKTEILLAVKGLELEVTLLNITLAKKQTVNTEDKERCIVERKNSDDSGIVAGDEYTEINTMFEGDTEYVTTVEKADFSCQHDGFFETSFDEDEMQEAAYDFVTNYDKSRKLKMEDFECQFDSPICITSDIIDVDDTLELSEKEDIGLDPCIPETSDASTDPIFQDLNTIHHLEEKVSELELLLLDLVSKDATLSEYERQIKRCENMCGVANVRYKRAREELAMMRLALMMAAEEGNNMRADLEKIKSQEYVNSRIKKLEENLETTLVENTQLQENKKELEDRILSLELDQRRQSYYPDNYLRLQLNCAFSNKQSEHILRLSQDNTSSVSSGFASGFETSEYDFRSLNEDAALQPLKYNWRLNELQEETERLSDLIGVMEEREEQLLEKVTEVEIFQKQAEEKVKEKDHLLVLREQKDKFGRKIKNALLLTAAFGAVHQAIQQEMVTNSPPM